MTHKAVFDLGTDELPGFDIILAIRHCVHMADGMGGLGSLVFHLNRIKDERREERNT